MPLPTLEEIERADVPEKQLNAEKLEQQVRLTFNSEDPKATWVLEWHGGVGKQPTRKVLRPGESVVRPVWQARSWFGPFDVYMEFNQTPRENGERREYLKKLFKAERDRYLLRFDWPRLSQRDHRKIGANRSPDFTVQMLEDDGSESSPAIRLFELYRIGEFDPDKDTFNGVESIESVRAMYETQLAAKDEEIRAVQAAQNDRIAELAGMIKGAAMVGRPLEASKEKAPA